MSIGDIIYGFLRAFLPWFFSGEKSTVVKRVAGLDDLRPNTITGTRLLEKSLPAMLVAIIVLPGCMQIGGKETVHEVIMSEPGSVVEIADDRPIRIIVKTPDGKEVVTTKRLAGQVSQPKTIYRRLREHYVENPPAVPLDQEK